MSKEERSGRKALLREAWFDRDLSWLEFNRRVLSEALDDRTPLLERLKFLAIFTSNLDEFFMKRVGAMRTRAYASRNPVSVDQFHDHMVSLRAALFPMLVEQANMVIESKDTGMAPDIQQMLEEYYGPMVDEAIGACGGAAPAPEGDEAE